MRLARACLPWAAALLIGCPDDPPASAAEESAAAPDAAPAGSSPRTRPVSPQPLNAHRPDETRVRLDLAAVRAAVREHQMLHGGQNPPSISSLDLKLHYPADLTYDPATGRVKSETYPLR